MKTLVMRGGLLLCGFLLLLAGCNEERCNTQAEKDMMTWMKSSGLRPGSDGDRQMAVGLGLASFICHTNDAMDKLEILRNLKTQQAFMNAAQSVQMSLTNNLAAARKKDDVLYEDGRLPGLRVVHQTESIEVDEKRGRVYTICIAVQLDRETVDHPEKLKSLKTDLTIESWVSSPEFVRVLGPRLFVDREGVAWTVGVVSRDMGKQRHPREQKMLDSSAFTQASHECAKAFGVRLESKGPSSLEASALIKAMRGGQNYNRKVNGPILGNPIQLFVHYVRLDGCLPFL